MILHVTHITDTRRRDSTSLTGRTCLKWERLDTSHSSRLERKQTSSREYTVSIKFHGGNLVKTDSNSRKMLFVTARPRLLLLLACAVTPAPMLGMTQFTIPRLREMARQSSTALDYIMGVVLMNLPRELMSRIRTKLSLRRRLVADSCEARAT
ncbi:hypothetical protein RRG08_038664 [Elysia crispata]|uniref:Uncharacterized protein n=1 Tax=Elysia crispata TaxID=231223 RepID=A0AAE0ZJM3_9GAST|nr:hypothetical protein RRG08_038664 [Elysia crispata]